MELSSPIRDKTREVAEGMWEGRSCSYAHAQSVVTEYSNFTDILSDFFRAQCK